MGPMRIRATAERDGELLLRGVPVQKGQQVEVILLDELSDAAVLDVLRSDPGWAWLWSEAEDVYTLDDVR